MRQMSRFIAPNAIPPIPSAKKEISRMTIRKLVRVLLLSISGASAAFAQNMPADYDSVLKTVGKQGDFKANVLKINVPAQ
jgi:glutamine cyclotransferase